MKITRTSAYAISALLLLAEADSKEPTSARQLALAGAMPERFLLQVLRQLVKHGILRSYRGIEGGFVIARPLREITLLQVIEALDGPIVATLPRIEALNHEVQSQLERLLTMITRQGNTILASVTLEELRAANKQKSQTPVDDLPIE